MNSRRLMGIPADNLSPGSAAYLDGEPRARPLGSASGLRGKRRDSLGLLGLVGAPWERDALRGSKPEEPSTSCASYSVRRYPLGCEIVATLQIFLIPVLRRAK
jgi:hypothetical protein